jgi:hypothetical protein
VTVQNSAGLIIYEDPCGFSLLDDDDDEGDDQVDVVYAGSIEVYITFASVDIGGTASYASTQDQTPYITSISPNNVTPSPSAQTAVCVTVSGGGFGSGGQINISGDSTLQWSQNNGSCPNQWSDSEIQTTFLLSANATPGGRSVSVTSGGALGSFFFGPAGAATSNPATFTVGGSNCSITIANNGQLYDIGSDYVTATIPLLASSSCTGTVTWELSFFYQSTGMQGT